MAAADAMADFLPYYSLEENPFRSESYLDPLLDFENESKRLIAVDGFDKLGKIDECLEKNKKNKKTSYFLVTGRSGAGRTSAANYVLARYCQIHNISPQRFVVPKRDKDENPYQLAVGEYPLPIYTKWFLLLYDEIDRAHILEDEVMERELSNATTGLSEENYTSKLRRIVRRLNESLYPDPPSKKEPAGFGLCLEDISRYSYIQAALDIFDAARTVCVFSVGAYDSYDTYVIKPFKAKFGPDSEPMIIDLGLMNGNDVKRLVEERWRVVSDCESPFDSEGIRREFDDNPRIVGEVLNVLTAVIYGKSTEHIGKPPYPQNKELRISKDDIRRYTKIWDSGSKSKWKK